MDKTGQRSYVFRGITCLIALIFLSLSAPPAVGDATLSRFYYEINFKVVVDGIDMLYVPLGKSYGIKYSTTGVEESGPGSLILTMYSGGTLIWSQKIEVTESGVFTRLVPAPVFRKSDKSFGPFYLCATEQLVSGFQESGAPCSQWTYIPIEVPLSLVSNGCGGMTGIGFIDKLQKGFLDKQTLAPGVTVDFRKACNVHDAGYSGLTVKDPIRNVIGIYHWSSRAWVDLQFRTELKTLCTRLLTKPNSTSLRTKCEALADRYYNVVRKAGYLFYDVNPAKPGDQISYVENSVGYPIKVKRDNA